MRTSRHLRVQASTFLFFSVFLATARHGDSQGFGMTKASVKLHRKLPALFLLKGTELSVKVKSTAANTSSIAQALGPLVETMLQQSDKRVIIENAKPQTLIECNITNYVPPQIQKLTRGTAVPTKKGTQQPQPYTKVTGDLVVAYRAKDVRTGRALDAAVLESKINQDYEQSGQKTKSLKDTFGGGLASFGHSITGSHQEEDAVPATSEAVTDRMVRQIAADLAKRIVTTDELVSVMLARGKLEPAAKLAESGLWPRMLDNLEGIPPFPKQTDEAYRLYDIGVAYEAMGYAAPDPAQGLKMFEQAAINYGKAIENDPQEKYFLEPQNRIDSALVVLKTLVERAKSGGQPTGTELAETKPADIPAVGNDGLVPHVEASPKPPKTAKTAENLQGPVSEPDTLTNAEIIELARSGANDETLISNIHDASKVKFDLTITGQKELLEAKVSNNVIAAMRQKARVAVPARRNSAGSAAHSGSSTPRS